MPLNEKQKKELEKLYEQGASYAFIAKQIGADSIKQVDNYIYKSGLSAEYAREKGARGGGGNNCLAPVHRLRKDEIIWLSKHYCKKHGSPFLTCYDCYLEENPEMNRIGAIDLECSSLNASFGIILSYAIYDKKNNKIYGRTITKKELAGDLDKQITQDCVNDMYNFDTLISYFGTGFDFPFVRSRAVHHGIEFPTYGALKNLDLFYVIKSKFKLHRKSLDQACEILLGSTTKTRITPEYWVRCLQGNEEALAYIWDHNKKDVEETFRLYEAVIEFRYPGRRSI